MNIITIIMQERSGFKPYPFVIAIQEAANNCLQKAEDVIGGTIERRSLN